MVDFDAVQAGDLDDTVGEFDAERFPGLAAHRWVLAGTGRRQRFCSRQAAAETMADVAAAGELTAAQHELALGLLLTWTGTVGELVQAARTLQR